MWRLPRELECLPLALCCDREYLRKKTYIKETTRRNCFHIKLIASTLHAWVYNVILHSMTDEVELISQILARVAMLQGKIWNFQEKNSSRLIAYQRKISMEFQICVKANFASLVEDVWSFVLCQWLEFMLSLTSVNETQRFYSSLNV